MPDGEAAIGAAAAHAVLTSTVPSSAAAPRRPPRRILSGTDLAAPRAPPAAPPAARTAATAFASTSPAAARSAPDGPLLPANAALLAELHRDAGELAGAVSELLASLRDTLSRGTACTAEHLGLYAAASEGVASETRDAVRGASAFVAAAQQLAAELPALDHLAEQTQQVRTQLEALEAAAAKVLPPPPAPPRAGVASLFSRSST